MTALSYKFKFQLLDFWEIQVKAQAGDSMAGGSKISSIQHQPPGAETESM
jgi:hypothetical protein